jgi:hypothetical protein
MPIEFDKTNKFILITSPTTEVTIQDLYNAIKDYEDELRNIELATICLGAGKSDLGGSVFTAITLTLSSLWRVKFWNGVGVGIVKDGNLVGGVADQPIEPTGGTDTIIVNNSVGGTIAITGSGVTQQDIDDIIDGVWDETKSEHVIVGSFGEILDTKISTRSSFTIQQLVDGVLDEDLTSHLSADTLGLFIQLIKRYNTNKLTIDDSNPLIVKLQIWNDAGDSIIYEHVLTDKDGEPVTLQDEIISNRGVQTVP